MVNSKIVTLERALEIFNEIENPNSNDYMELFVKVARVRRNPDGLSWVQIKEALEGIVDYNY